MAFKIFGAIVGLTSLQGFVQADILCAAPGEALCGSASDMAVVNTAEFATNVTKAGGKSFLDKIPGAEAIALVIGKGTLSPGCLACQGSALDCGQRERNCMRICLQGACSDACRTCMTETCSITAACGGVPGVSIQRHYTCGTSNNLQNLTVNENLANLNFTGTCCATYSSNTTICQDHMPTTTTTTTQAMMQNQTVATQLSGTVDAKASLTVLLASAAALVQLQ
eukprot:TRINITY_DN121079_c0_g1_i1.p1 TRINITY_DN121079_c0_g1~~TRINITY_DN121079_c0_g1_i1.p1  ORF type:complete len:225 (-),score=44.78 TRINITY_DN121079_c0_g1_i1:266-940(-)